jgi:hypothetical protein
MAKVAKTTTVEPVGIPKPDADTSIGRFKSKRAATLAGVETLPTALPHHRIADAKDFVRLHPNEDSYWSDVLCFVSVPIQGQNKDTLHLILEDLAMQYLSSAKIQRFRLALGAKPYGKFFLCHVPSENLENTFNQTALVGCAKAKQYWVEVTSRLKEGVDGYHIGCAQNQDAFPDPKWPSQSLFKLIEVTFAGRMIESADHPALLRLIGAKQVLG